MFYKIVRADNTVADVFDRLIYCRYELRSHAIIGCGEAEKQGVASERRRTYYHVVGWPDLGIEAQDVTLSEITESEYNELKTRLDKEDADSEAIAEVKNDLSKTNDAMSITFVTLSENGAIDEVTAAEHSELFADWQPGVSYTTGQIRRSGGNLYRCLQAHTSQIGWEPESAPSLWKKIGDPTVEFPEWSQPIGAGDAYMTGDKVSYDGQHWVSAVDNNVWRPGDPGTENLWVVVNTVGN